MAVIYLLFEKVQDSRSHLVGGRFQVFEIEIGKVLRDSSKLSIAHKCSPFCIEWDI